MVFSQSPLKSLYNGVQICGFSFFKQLNMLLNQLGHVVLANIIHAQVKCGVSASCSAQKMFLQFSSSMCPGGLWELKSRLTETDGQLYGPQT